MVDTITGQEIVRLYSLGTGYDNQSIGAVDDKENHYRMKVEEIVKFPTDFNGIVFNKVKKKVHMYLEVQL